MKVYLFFYSDRSDRCDIYPRKPDCIVSSIKDAVDTFRDHPLADKRTEEDGGSTGCIYLEDWRHDNGPDFWLSFGPRGGVKKERG